MSYSTPSWMDFDCFVKFYKPTSISHIADVSLLEPEDQEDLRKGIGECSGQALVKLDPDVNKSNFQRRLLLALSFLLKEPLSGLIRTS